MSWVPFKKTRNSENSISIRMGKILEKNEILMLILRNKNLISNSMGNILENYISRHKNSISIYKNLISRKENLISREKNLISRKKEFNFD